MLSDDVSEAAGKTVSTTGAVVGGTVRGGLLGAAATFAAGTLAIGGSAALGALSGGLGIGAAATAAVTGTVVGAGFMVTAGLPLLIAGAAIGAALLGLGALIPGVKDMWNGAKKLVHHDREQVPVQTVDVQQNCPAPRVRRTIVCDNPDFEPGRGAKMMEKGDCAQSANICR